MKLTKVSTMNEFKWEGLTLGKLIAIKNVLERAENQDCITPVENEVLAFLKHRNLDSIECFGPKGVIR